MFFSRFIIDTTFDTNRIEKLYELLSKDIPDLELVWRYKREIVDNPSEADNVSILNNYKTFFTLVETRNRGNIRFSLVKGYEQIVLNALKETGITVEPQSFSTPIICVFAYILLFIIACAANPDYAPFLSVLFVILLSGIISYAISAFKNYDCEIPGYSSVLTIIGLVCFSPSSLLLFPLITALNKQKLHNLIEQDN